MPIKHDRTVLHLAVTENTALRVILYIAKEKVEWYNAHNLHNLVLSALYTPILDYITRTQGQSSAQRQKDSDTTQTIQMEGFRILYRFAARTSQQTIIRAEKSYTFTDQEESNEIDTQDRKPTVQTKYEPLSLYPYQLLVSVDNELFVSSTNTLDAYFTAF